MSRGLSAGPHSVCTVIERWKLQHVWKLLNNECVQTGDALVQVVCGLWMLFFLQTSDRQMPQRSRINKEDVLDIKSPLQTDAGTRGLLALSCNNKRAAVVVARPAHTGRGRTAAGQPRSGRQTRSRRFPQNTAQTID